MNPLIFLGFVITVGIIIYLIVLLLGFASISQNRKAQGIEKDTQ